MNTKSEDYSFSKFADLDFYRRINSRLLDLSNIQDQKRVIDLGCGTGGVTRLVLDRLQLCRDSMIYAIDHSASAIKQAVSELDERRNAAVRFIQGDATSLADKIKEKVDAVIYCNSIHYVLDKEKLLHEIKQSLRPGGTLSFNTSFFDGSHPPESQEFYRRWMMRSLRILKREYGLRPVRSDKVTSRKHLSANEYSDLLVSQGFEVTNADLMEVDVPLQGWVDISGYSDFIEGVMPGVPMDKASSSLQQGASEIYNEKDLKSVKRHWLGMVATSL